MRNQSTKSTESVESRFNSKYQFFLSYVIKKSEIYPIIALYLIFKKALFKVLCSCRNVARWVNIG